MRVEHLSLTNFRNYARLEISLPGDAPIVLVGDNAQGKTSLLEALYYLATSRSPYTTSDRQLIHWRVQDDLMPFAYLSAEVNGGGRFNELEVALTLEQVNGASQRLQKTVKVNKSKKRVMDVIGLLNVVLFLPQDLSLVEGTPSDRRQFMNTTLAQVDKAYYLALEQYEKTLPQRNALLKRIAEKQAAPDELTYWDRQLVQSGSVLIAGRQQFLRELEVAAQRAHHDLTGNRETLTLQYKPSFVPTAEGDGQRSFDLLGLDLHREIAPESIAPQFLQQLEDERADSIQRGMTLSGPHRDELRLSINARDAGVYGSRGQARTAVMALKLAELHWMKQRTGEWPVLLLDEVIAELDSKRRAYLLERLSGVAQTLMTTTELDIFTRSFLEHAVVWRVEDGQITVR